MNSTPQTPENKFSLGSEPNVKILYLTLVISAVVALLITLLVYVLRGGTVSNRLDFGIVMSLLPALGAFIFLRLTKRFVSWQAVAILYLVLFVLLVLIQAFGRTITLGS
jgi:lysylphosphatidylglycerol synthetase-like protein (DUF2156 family)